MTEHGFLTNLKLYKPVFAQGRPINVEELLNTHFGFEHVPLRNEGGEQIAPSVGNDLTRRHPRKVGSSRAMPRNGSRRPAMNIL
jgi:hypothetical protein